MKLIIASNNAHKLIEIKAILGGMFDEIVSMREAGIEHETIEDGATFMENAEKKAREIAGLSGCCALADDSGLCVDALGGAPGIFSARFSGVHGDDEANNRLLLEKLRDTDERGAHYSCAVALVRPDGSCVGAEGRMYGSIARAPAGSNGFGYDPLFWSTELHKGMAEATMQEKNKISHRGKAIRKLVAIWSKKK